MMIMDDGENNDDDCLMVMCGNSLTSDFLLGWHGQHARHAGHARYARHAGHAEYAEYAKYAGHGDEQLQQQPGRDFKT